ncbi:MAG: hypothetical protein MJD61_05690 [Proteobacteria bacterium]|nr:hypothetical protein [Pseudomonadota bacterium]
MLPGLLALLFSWRPALGQSDTDDRFRQIVFQLDSSSDDALVAAVREALDAQMTASKVRIDLERESVAKASLHERIEQARRRAVQRPVLGVFWLDAHRSGDWLLYLFAPEGDRVLVRRIPATSEAQAAAVEAVSVITQSATSALLRGHRPGMQPVQRRFIRSQPRAKQAAAQKVTQPRKVSRPAPVYRRISVRRDTSMVFAVGHGPQLYAPSQWQRTTRFAIGAELRSRYYLGVQYWLVPALSVDFPQTSMTLRRHPLAFFAGLRNRLGPLTLSADMSLVGELVTRRSVPNESTTPDTSRVVWAMAPRLRIGLRPLASLELYLAGSLDMFFTFIRFSEAERDPSGRLSTPQVLLDPYRFRPTLELGLAWLPYGQ